VATIVAFHARPDDEVLATGGTLARLAAEGHRVVIVVATDGVMRLARVMLALPVPVFGLFFGREWFVEPGAATTTISSGILHPAPHASAHGTGL
jgi:hypothetical protein